IWNLRNQSRRPPPLRRRARHRHLPARRLHTESSSTLAWKRTPRLSRQRSRAARTVWRIQPKPCLSSRRPGGAQRRRMYKRVLMPRSTCYRRIDQEEKMSNHVRKAALLGLLMASVSGCSQATYYVFQKGTYQVGVPLDQQPNAKKLQAL